MNESIRGCGWRVIGGLYLYGTGLTTECDRLPFIIEACPTCGAQNIAVVRAPRGIDASRLFGGTHIRKNSEVVYPPPECPEDYCPVCRPHRIKSAFLLGVGREYTTKTFIEEAIKMGVSKAIPSIPKDLMLGESWVFLTHAKGGLKAFDKHEFEGEVTKSTGAAIEVELTEYPPDAKCKHCQEPLIGKLNQAPTKCWRKIPAVFYAFKPQRVEMLIWKSEAISEYIQQLEKRGITPIIIEDTEENRKRHSPEGKRKYPRVKFPEQENTKKLDGFTA